LEIPARRKCENMLVTVADVSDKYS
jgi:hypothetical protein